MSVSVCGCLLGTCSYHWLFNAYLLLCFCSTKPILSAKQKIQLQEKLEYVHEVVKTKKVSVCVSSIINKEHLSE